MKLAVFGHPIAHSKSPSIHHQFARSLGHDVSYTKQDIEPDTFETEVLAFFKEGGSGLNITLPFKERAFALAQQHTASAKAAKAVNTLFMHDGVLWGGNTDGIGLVADLSHYLKWPIEDKKVLLLGAGGAARGVLQPLLSQNPKSITIANRTVSKAEALAQEFGLIHQALSELGSQSFDIIINASSAGLSGEAITLPSGIVGAATCVYDMVYGSEPTAFMSWAMGQGAKCSADGLGMLLEQAAESYCIWTGQRPSTQSLRDDQTLIHC